VALASGLVSLRCRRLRGDCFESVRQPDRRRKPAFALEKVGDPTATNGDFDGLIDIGEVQTMSGNRRSIDIDRQVSVALRSFQCGRRTLPNRRRYPGNAHSPSE
jgi:hypothetical protein